MAKVEEESEAVVPGNTGGTDSRMMFIRLKLPPEARGSFGGGVGSEKVTAEDLLVECVRCGKRFGSAKALGGHMRVHRQRRQEDRVEERQELAEEVRRRVGSAENSSRKPLECRVCGKEFRTLKSLCGHMRLHPDREWRGVQPPAGEVRPEPVITGRSVTGKHGRRSASASLDLPGMIILSPEEATRTGISR